MELEYIFVIISFIFLLALIFFIIFKPQFMSRFEIAIICLLGFFAYGLLCGAYRADEDGLVAIFFIVSTCFLILAFFFLLEKPRFLYRWQMFFICLIGFFSYGLLGGAYYNGIGL